MVDRKKVMSWLEGLAQQDWRMFHSDSEVQVIAESALALIKEQEADEPKTGHWIEDETETYTENHDTWECSECHEPFTLTEGTPEENTFYFCPRCGAKMEFESR